MIRLTQSKALCLLYDEAAHTFHVLRDPVEHLDGIYTGSWEYKSVNPRVAFLAFKSMVTTRDLKAFEPWMADHGYDPLTGELRREKPPPVHRRAEPRPRVTCGSCAHGWGGSDTCPQNIPRCINGTPLKQEQEEVP